MRHWIKPFGTSRPARPLPDEWTDRLPLDPFTLMSGPAKPETPPEISCGDLVILHAVIHARVFGAVKIVNGPEFTTESRWAPRWPWIYRCRVDVWVPRISDGPRSSAIVPKRAIGRIQRGGQYARLSDDDYEACVSALLRSPGVERRSSPRTVRRSDPAMS